MQIPYRALGVGPEGWDESVGARTPRSSPPGEGQGPKGIESLEGGGSLREWALGDRARAT